MQVFFKLNNHKGGYNQVAYYHHQAPHNHVNWSATKFLSGLGQVLYLCSNEFGRNGTVGYTSHSNSNGHFGYPAKGDLVVIFQQVYKMIRVVTHVLEFQDNLVRTFQNVFGNTHPVVQNFTDWPYLRETKIVAVLKPSEFIGMPSTNLPDLVSTVNPDRAKHLDDLTTGSVSVGNGRIYQTYGDHKQLDLKTLKNYLSNNPAYDCISPL